MNFYKSCIVFEVISHPSSYPCANSLGSTSLFYTLAIYKSREYLRGADLDSSDIKCSYSGMKKLCPFIRAQKNRLPKMMHSNVVYKISCKDSDASYVGQTGRMLKNRINEHKRHMRRNTSTHSVITDHRLLGNKFDWENIEILDEEPILEKKLYSEMLHIS